jgi:hypothetical protein
LWKNFAPIENNPKITGVFANVKKIFRRDGKKQFSIVIDDRGGAYRKMNGFSQRSAANGRTAHVGNTFDSV